MALAEILRNLVRRRTRTLLTVSGIFVGVLALTVLGALAERMNMMVSGGEQFFARQISAIPGGAGRGRGIVLPEHIAQVQAVAGVKAVTQRVELPYEGARGAGFGPPPMVYGVQFNAAAPAGLTSLPLTAGRQLQPDDRGLAVAGADLAAENDWRVGDTIMIQGVPFKLVGILQRMMTAPDQWLFVSIDEARTLLIESTPLLRTLLAPSDIVTGSGGFDSSHLAELATSLQVLWDDDTDPEELSRVLQGAVPDLTFISPATASARLAQGLIVINLIVMGSALIALVVGGLSVVNTMTMSVTERRSEIALKRALGAPTRAIIGEFLAESALIGIVGGFVGIGVGMLMVLWLNSLGAASHTQVFLVTGRLVVFALAFSALLGALSGLGPAVHAARLNPIDGLREE